MAERTAKLPLNHVLVVWACPDVTLGEKAVFHHDWMLDRGDENGAYMSSESMGTRLAVVPRYIEKARNRLKLVGLHEKMFRKGCRNVGWVSSLPPACRPMGAVVDAGEIIQCAARLSEHIRRADEWRTRQSVETTPESQVRPHRTVQSQGRSSAWEEPTEEGIPSPQVVRPFPPSSHPQDHAREGIGEVANSEEGRLPPTGLGSEWQRAKDAARRVSHG